MGNLDDFSQQIEQFDEAEELHGNLGYGEELMHSVIEADEEKIDEGKMIQDATNQGLGAFIPDVIFDKLVNNYKMAEKLYGQSLLQRLSGYSSKYIEKNINTPEFQRELKKKIDKKIRDLKDESLLDNEGNITDKGIELSSLVLYVEELDSLVSKGKVGEKLNKTKDLHGSRQDIRSYKKGDRYRDISMKKTIKTAIKRSHKNIQIADLRISTRESLGNIEVVYGVDSSSSMKGLRIKAAKKAGVALAFNAIQEKDKVGLIIFGDEVKDSVAPGYDFEILLKKIAKITTRGQTNFVATLKTAQEMFSSDETTKHLVLITDALPTVGEDPLNQTRDAVNMVAANGITVSLIGISLDAEGAKIAQEIAELGNGRFYQVRDLENVDKIILEDYYSIK